MDRLLERDVCELLRRVTGLLDQADPNFRLALDFVWSNFRCGVSAAGGRAGVRPPGSRRLLLCLGLPEVPLRETCFENGVILLSLHIKSIVLIAEKMNVKSQQLLSSCSGRLQISPILCPPFA